MIESAAESRETGIVFELRTRHASRLIASDSRSSRPSSLRREQTKCVKLVTSCSKRWIGWNLPSEDSKSAFGCGRPWRAVVSSAAASLQVTVHLVVSDGHTNEVGRPRETQIANREWLLTINEVTACMA